MPPRHAKFMKRFDYPAIFFQFGWSILQSLRSDCPRGLEVQLFAWYDQYNDQIEKNPWNAAGDQRDQECKAEPERADPEKFRQAAADARHHAIPLRAS